MARYLHFLLFWIVALAAACTSYPEMLTEEQLRRATCAAGCDDAVDAAGDVTPPPDVHSPDSVSVEDVSTDDAEPATDAGEDGTDMVAGEDTTATEDVDPPDLDVETPVDADGDDVDPATDADETDVDPPTDTEELDVDLPTDTEELDVDPPTDTEELDVDPPTDAEELDVDPPTDAEELDVDPPTDAEELDVDPPTDAADDTTDPGDTGTTTSWPGCEIPIVPTATCGKVQCPAPWVCTDSVCKSANGRQVYVGADLFWRGCDPAVATECQPEEAPVHPVYLDAFAIDTREVTYKDFAAFLNQAKPDNVCAPAAATLSCTDTLDTSACIGEASWPLVDSPPGTWTVSNGAFDYAAKRVTWFGAKAYCEWKGMSLCTEAQWEMAARGSCAVHGLDPLTNCKTDLPKFPWGAGAAECGVHGAFDECPGGSQTVVGQFPQGNSPYGVKDMAGSVPEWVADAYAKDIYCLGEDAYCTTLGVCISCEENPGWPGAPCPMLNPHVACLSVGTDVRTIRDTSSMAYYRATIRYGGSPEFSNSGTGFRCCDPTPE